MNIKIKKSIIFLIFGLGIFFHLNTVMAKNVEISQPTPASSFSKKDNINPSLIIPPSIVLTYVIVHATSATFYGSINPNGLNTKAWFELFNSSDKLGLQNTNGNSIISLTPYTISGLNTSTSYKFRLVASNSNGSNRSNWIVFNIKNGIVSNNNLNPSLISASPNNGTQGDNNLNINLNGTGFTSTSIVAFSGTGIIVNSIIVNSSTSITLNISINDSAPIGNRNISVTNMNPVSTNTDQSTGNIFPIVNINNSNNNPLIFTVNPKNNNSGGSGSGGGGYIIKYPNVITQNATNLSKNSAVLNGSINPSGRTVNVWFEYGIMANLLSFNQTPHITFGSGSSYAIHSQGILNLNPNTTYYFRAVASNSSGTTRGNIFSFTTSKANNVITNNTGGDIEPIYEENNNYSEIDNTTPENQPIDDRNYFNSRNLGASAVWGFTNILPKTFIGWLIFLILILILIIIIRELYEDHSKRKLKNIVNANHIENLPV